MSTEITTKQTTDKLTNRQPIMFKLLKNLTISVLLITLGGVLGYQVAQGKGGAIVNRIPVDIQELNAQQPAEYQNVDFKQFWEVWSILERQYLDPEKINPQEQIYGAIQGMTSSLDDPFTMYLPPDDQKRATEDLAGAFSGVGIQLGYKDGLLAVMAPLKGSPAASADVQAGDLILHITDTQKNIDEDTTDMNLFEAVEKIRGPKGTPVTLKLFREGRTEPFDVTLKRDEILVPSVELTMIEKDGKKIAHIQLSRFGDRTKDEWSKVVDQIVLTPDVTGVLLDVRNNPGGYLDGSIDIASEFIKDGVVVSQQGRTNTQKYTVSRKGRLTELPVEVLINKGSASASEIVAGALRDRRDAQLIGENSFGKGTVQDALQLGNGAGLHVTIGRWLLPSGDWIHEKGIPADVEIKDDPNTEEDEVVNKAIELM